MSRTLNKTDITPEMIRLARHELKRRASQKSLAPFVTYTTPNYLLGWVHAEICKTLDQFLQDVIDKKNPRLIICMPPRSGKSQLVSRSFPAYALGRYPDLQIMAVSYSADLSSRFNRDVQRIIDSPEYASVFPETTLSGQKTANALMQAQREQGGRLGGYIRTSDLFEIVGHKGSYRSTGVGGGVTGMGAECVTFDTLVATPSGEKPITSLSVGSPVISYNIKTNQLEICFIEAIRVKHAKSVNELYRESGRSIKCTGNHPVFTKGGYTPADLLAKGAPVLCCVWEGICDPWIRISQKNPQRTQAFFLLQELHRKLFSKKMHRATFLQKMQKTSWKILKLLRGMQKSSTTMEKRERCSGNRESLRFLWKDFSSSTPRTRKICALLFNGVQKFRTFHKDERAFSRNVWKLRSEFVASNKKLSKAEGYAVIDLQISGCHNFFANGVLVHNCLIIDDPLKDRAAANSLTIRNSLWDWYTSTAYTRLSSGGGVIVMCTRWHQDDLIGRLLAEHAEPWHVINYPAIAEHDEPHRKAGEALHPERFDLEALNRIKVNIGSHDWAALYQQHPLPEGGALFKDEWLKTYDAKTLPPKFDSLLGSWDMTFKDSAGGDFVVGTVWGTKGAEYYLLDLVRGQWDFVKTLEMFEQLQLKWPKVSRWLIEDKANGSAVISTIKKSISGVLPITPTESKLARASAVTPLFEAGNVYIPANASWVADYRAELLSFPSGAHDDCVDSTSQALNYMRQHKAFTVHPSNLRALHRHF